MLALVLPTLSSHAAAASLLLSLSSTPCNFITSKENEYGSHFAESASQNSARWAKSSRVKDGLPEIFCLKRGKALRATRTIAPSSTAEGRVGARNLRPRARQQVAEENRRRNVMVLRQASETGQLFDRSPFATSSPRSRGVWASHRPQPVMLDARSKSIAGTRSPSPCIGSRGRVTVTVARSADEAERINRGEDILPVRKIGRRPAEAARRRRRILRPGSRRDEVEPRRRRFRQVTPLLTSN